MRKGLLALLLVLLPGIASAQPFVRYYPPPGVAELTSSGTAITSTVPLLLPDGSSAAPSLGFTSDSDGSGSGLYRYGANQIGFATNGIARGVFLSGGLVASFWLPQNIATISMGSAQDVFVERDAANTLALRNGTNAQTFNIYNTYTDASNYERLGMFWSTNIAGLVVSVAGTGVSRPLGLGTSGQYRWYVGSGATAPFYPATTDFSDIGGASNQVASAFVSRSIQGSKSKALTDNTATAFVRLSVADDDYEHCNVIYTAYAEDTATDARQIRAGNVHAAILNNSGTETVAFSTGDSSVVVTAGTFTCTFDGNSASADTIDLRATCDTSLAATTTITFEYRLDCPSTVTVTPQ